jgi:co-chaperonin GroES (HSP10)
MKLKLEALYNAVIVEPLELEEISYGNIIVPDLGNEKNKLGKVVTIGKGYYSVTGRYIETILKVGDIVILPTMGFSKLEHEGKEYWVGPENQCLGRLIEDNGGDNSDPLPF